MPKRIVFFSTSLFILCLSAIFFRTHISRLAQAEVGPTSTITYTEDTSIFPNPERGWYWAYNPFCCSQDEPHEPFTVSELEAQREKPEAVTLIADRIQIGQFLTSEISQDYLDEIEDNWDAARQAGVKVIVRFLYDWSVNNRDATKTWIETHMDQLEPLLERNKDVIAWVQGGFYGGSGEANGSDNGYVTEDLDHDLSDDGAELYVKWYNAMPDDRFILFRYPRLTLDMKMRSFPTYNWTASLSDREFPVDGDGDPITLSESEAYGDSFDAQVGFYSDGYAGDENHFGMFQITDESDFTAGQTNYVPFEGEISTVNEYNSADNLIVTDMTRYHTTAMNLGITDADEIFDIWDANGDYDEITKRMGYRYRLNSATIPRYLAQSDTLNLSLVMTNDGFARIINPRNVELIFRNTQTSDVYTAELDYGKGNRLWFPAPGEQETLSISTSLPANIPTGDYELLLNLPDPMDSLHDRSEYSIRLANTGMWEESTGYNDLNHTITINGVASSQSSSGGGGGGGSSSSSSSSAGCSASTPGYAPDLFQIDVQGTQATLYFAPVVGNTNKYAVVYGTQSGVEQFGVEFDEHRSDGVLFYTIKNLAPNTTYYFRVRAGNGCMPGPWGTEMSARSSSIGNTKIIKYYKNFPLRVIKSLPTPVQDAIGAPSTHSSKSVTAPQPLPVINTPTLPTSPASPAAQPNQNPTTNPPTRIIPTSTPLPATQTRSSGVWNWLHNLIGQ